MNLIFPLSKPSSHHFSRLRPHSPQPISSTPPKSTATTTTTTTGVVVIGAGLAGLAAATHLHSKNIPFLLLEASDSVGGRVKTDRVDGFLLDRGFQIFITGYPEARKLLDYRSLDLQKFYSGARVYFDGEFHTVADPLRHFSDSLLSLTNPIGSVLDKLLIGLTRIRVLRESDHDIFSSVEVPILDMLYKTGFSPAIVDRFFRPFFGGIFFDAELQTSSRLFDFVFKCLALGDNSLPAKGIAAIPQQLAEKLPSSSISFSSKVISIDSSPDSEKSTLRLENGEIIGSEFGVIVAVEEPEAERLLAGKITTKTVEPGHKRPARSTCCLYFSADEAPTDDPVLFLNGSGIGIVNNMFFATNVARSYAPAGKTLVSVSVIGRREGVSDEDLTDEVVRELSSWFGDSDVRSWKHLRTYRVDFAQPNQCPPTDLFRDPRVGSGVYLCGDHWSNATFDGALVSGRRAAEALIKDRALASMGFS